MIHHSVIFLFKPTVDDSRAQAFFDAANELSSIEGVLDFECLQQVSDKNHFRYGIRMDFENEAFYQQYNSHPLHSAFLQLYWLPFVEDFLEIDYVKME